MGAVSFLSDPNHVLILRDAPCGRSQDEASLPPHGEERPKAGTSPAMR